MRLPRAPPRTPLAVFCAPRNPAGKRWVIPLQMASQIYGPQGPESPRSATADTQSEIRYMKACSHGFGVFRLENIELNVGLIIWRFQYLVMATKKKFISHICQKAFSRVRLKLIFQQEQSVISYYQTWFCLFWRTCYYYKCVFNFSLFKHF